MDTLEISKILDPFRGSLELEDGFTIEEQLEHLKYGITQAVEHQNRQTKRFAKAFHGSPMGQVITNEYGSILDVNLIFCKMLGYSEPEELKYSNIKDIVHPDYWLEPESFAKMLREKGVLPKCYGTKLKTTSGSYRDARVTITKLDGDEVHSGFYLGYVCELKCYAPEQERCTYSIRRLV